MDNQSANSVGIGGFLPIVLTLAGFGLFLLLVHFFWTENRPTTVVHGGYSRAERLEILKELRAHDSELLNTYGWVDQGAGTVRLPIERAMDVTLAEINEGRTQN